MVEQSWGTRVRLRVARLGRTARRLLVLTTVAGYPAMFGWVLADRDGDEAAAFWRSLSIAVLFVAAVAGTVLTMWTRNRADPDDEALDERERQVRDHVYLLSYRIVGIALFAGFLVFGFASTRSGPLVLTFDMIAPLYLGTGAYLAVLPTLVLAWIELDAPDENS